LGSSKPTPLTAFERAFLERFFRSVEGFCLTGGVGLAEVLRHRRSLDLDLFTTSDESFRAASVSLRPRVRERGGRAEVVVDAPAFRRLVLTDAGGEVLRVDLVRDRSPRTGPSPRREGDLVLDSLEEILANKICAILTLGAMEDAMRKDGGLTPSALAWAVSQVPLDRLPENLLAPLSLEALREFADRLRSDLARMGFPRTIPWP
jgi:hypothetical protein